MSDLLSLALALPAGLARCVFLRRPLVDGPEGRHVRGRRSGSSAACCCERVSFWLDSILSHARIGSDGRVSAWISWHASS